MVNEDPFWDIQLGSLNDPISKLLPDEKSCPQISWSAPVERECMGEIMDSLTECYEESSFSIPMGHDRKPVQLVLTSLEPDRNLLGHVGQELWDAAYLLSAFLITLQRNSNCLFQGQKIILELGSGCGLVGIVAALLGTGQVVLSDYSPSVLQNLYSNIARNRKTLQEMNPTGTIFCTTLNWERYLQADSQELDWMHEQSTHNDTIESTRDEYDEVDLTHVDWIIGSALVYSVDGAFMCADTIHHFFENCHLTKASVLQMTARPGFDRFLLRLMSFGYSLNFLEISDPIVQLASVLSGREIQSQESFKLLEITKEGK